MEKVFAISFATLPIPIAMNKVISVPVTYAPPRIAGNLKVFWVLSPDGWKRIR